MTMLGYVVREKMRQPNLSVGDKMGTFGRRIVIPELNNLAITMFGGEILVFEGFEQSNETIIIKKQVEVPEKIVKAAQQFEESPQVLLNLDDELYKLTSLA